MEMQTNFEKGKQLQNLNYLVSKLTSSETKQNLLQDSEVLGTRVEQSLEIDSHIYGQLIFQHGPQVTQIWKKIIFP